ncbi:uncharacterized protein LOC133790992 [Humulus lupulus]|uniref:uncharacterized protein LOC133790992 n=1 Tax=Humulus lupulus TaxID=3486 RepID=UPI002B41583F|nr:uncharacterized protein LOC133790992 [Humulus lupulus]
MGFFTNQSFISLSIFLLIVSPSLVLASVNVVVSDERTAYEFINSFGFPTGILPKGVVGYDYDPSSGKFAAYFNGTCSFSVEGSYQLKYRSAINGYISMGELSRLEGVSVKLFWFWIDIVEVKRVGDDLEFSVGIAGAGFPVDNFVESPQCGCGLNCMNFQVRKLKTNVTVSSY